MLEMETMRDMETMAQVKDEVDRQRAKFGEQKHIDGTCYAGSVDDAQLAKAVCDGKARAGCLTWKDILNEEFREALAESDPDKLRTELIQVAAVCVNWIDCIDRREASRLRSMAPVAVTAPETKLTLEECIDKCVDDTEL